MSCAVNRVLGSQMEVGNWLRTITTTQGGNCSGLNEDRRNGGSGK